MLLVHFCGIDKSRDNPASRSLTAFSPMRGLFRFLSGRVLQTMGAGSCDDVAVTAEVDMNAAAPRELIQRVTGKRRVGEGLSMRTRESFLAAPASRRLRIMA